MLVPHAQQSATWRQFDQARHFVLFLFVTVPLGIITGWRTTAVSFESQIAVVSTLKNIGKPLFQDYSRAGRIIGILMRLARAAAGSLVQVVVLVFYLILLIGWYMLPFYLLYQIIRNGASFFGL